MDVSELWRRIDAVLARDFSDLATTLLPGAEASALSAAETRLGVALPDELRATLAAHDGQRPASGLLWRFDNFRLLGSNELSAGEGCMTIAEAANSDALALDLASGELRPLCHDDDEEPHSLGTFAAFLAALADDLEAGRYTLDEYGSLTRTWPDDETVEARLGEAAQMVVGEGGGLDALWARLAALFDQPLWVVQWRLSEIAVEEALEAAGPERVRFFFQPAEEAALVALLTARLGAVVGEWGAPFKNHFGDEQAERPLTLDGVACPLLRTAQDFSFEIPDVDGLLARVRAQLAEAGLRPAEASNR